MTKHDDTNDPTLRFVRPTRHHALAHLARGLLGLAAIIGLVVVSAVPGEASDAADDRRPGTTRSQAETAQAAVADEDGSLQIVVTAVDYVTPDGSGTNTAVDVFFDYGECNATGPLDLTIDQLRHARVVGELAAECYDFDTDQSFDATITVDLEWTGFGRVFQVPVILGPDDPCRSVKLQRRANIQGQVTIDGPDGGLHGTAGPVGGDFNALALQKDVCRA